MINKIEIQKLLIPIILNICCYNMDKNINYETYLTNELVSIYLKKYTVETNIIKYIEKNIQLEGEIYYLRNNVDSECMIFDSGTYCYLVFCGTQFNINDLQSLFKDIWTNICVGLKPIDKLHPQIKIHSKYKENMKDGNLIKKIIKIIKNKPYDKIYITGHSMGCGLGLYTSLVLCKKFSKKKFKLITFGQPKLGNCELNNYIPQIKNLKHINLINDNDYVQLFPFFYNYKHISNKTYFVKSEGTILLLDNIDINNKLSIFKNCCMNDHYTNIILKNIYNYLRINNFL
jgi:hypothetical protein